MLDKFGRRRTDQPRRFRRGVYLLPSLFTVANLFCGYACVVYATRADFETAALLIGIAMVLDTLDGFFARLTNSSSAFGVQLDSLADVVSFGLAPAILAFTWGLWPLERLGWAVGFLYVTAAAMRLARFNIQTTAAGDKRYFAGMPSPAAAAVIASTVYLYPSGLQEWRQALPCRCSRRVRRSLPELPRPVGFPLARQRSRFPVRHIRMRRRTSMKPWREPRRPMNEISQRARRPPYLLCDLPTVAKLLHRPHDASQDRTRR